MKKIVFLHIQKTAGNSIHQIFYNNRKGYMHLGYNEGEGITRDKIEDLSKSHFTKITGIGGHQIDCTKSNAYFGEDQFTFTVLRDPIDRYISFYNHMKTNHDYPFSFDDYLKGEGQHNFQTKAISKSDDLEKAKIILKENFDLVGIFKEMDKTLDLLSNKLDLDVEHRPLNRSKAEGLKLKDLTEKQYKVLKENNQLDLELYAFAKTLFDAQSNQKPSVRRVSALRKWLGLGLKKWVGWKMKTKQ